MKRMRNYFKVDNVYFLICDRQPRVLARAAAFAHIGYKMRRL